MNDLFLFWLSLSISGALVTLMLILLRPLLRRFCKIWQYYLWLLVVLRLLIPFSPEVNIVGELFQQVKTQFAVRNAPLTREPEFDFSEGKQSRAVSDIEITNPQRPPSAVGAFSVLKDHTWGILWLSIAMFLFIRKAVGYACFLKTVKRESTMIFDGQVPMTLQEVSTAMGIRKQIPVCTNPLIRAPMIAGFIHSIIVLPNKDIPSSELALIFRHELIHKRRMDFLYKWLVEIAVCLHWFNPFAYWVRKQINRDCELSCDEAVVACLTATERQTYGETLLNSIVINNLGNSHIVSLSLNKDGKLIKERLNAIMEYHRKPKWIVFIATVLTSVLLCGTVFAGSYQGVAMKNVQTISEIRPIHILDKEIAPEGKISLGSQHLVLGTDCQILLTWIGNSQLLLLCTSSDGVVKSLPVENGKATTLLFEAEDEYTIAVKNDNANKVRGVNGTITFQPGNQNAQSQNGDIPASLNTPVMQTITYKNVEMRRYEGADGHPYIHNIKENGTTKKIVGYQYGMLAFDKDGNPLKINWWSLDTEAESTFFYLDETSNEIAPTETYDVRGGWSLNFYGTDSSVARIAYILYCDKEIAFDNGIVWSNPNFDDWRSTYEGKKVDVKVLENYYPYREKITLEKEAKVDQTHS